MTHCLLEDFGEAKKARLAGRKAGMQIWSKVSREKK
jgi:hypothetical protein